MSATSDRDLKIPFPQKPNMHLILIQPKECEVHDESPGLRLYPPIKRIGKGVKEAQCSKMYGKDVNRSQLLLKIVFIACNEKGRCGNVSQL